LCAFARKKRKATESQEAWWWWGWMSDAWAIGHVLDWREGRLYGNVQGEYNLYYQ